MKRYIESASGRWTALAGGVVLVTMGLLSTAGESAALAAMTVVPLLVAALVFIAFTAGLPERPFKRTLLMLIFFPPTAVLMMLGLYAAPGAGPAVGALFFATGVLLLGKGGGVVLAALSRAGAEGGVQVDRPASQH